MKVSRERLSVIGKLIGIYREERRGNSQNNYTIRSFCDGICSPNTLKSIEAGNISRFDDVYERLLKKLDLKYGELTVIDEIINKSLADIYYSIEYYDKENVIRLSKKLLKILKQTKTYVYYSELYNIFCDLIDYYELDRMITFEQKQHYLKIVDSKCEIYLDIIKLLLYGSFLADSAMNINDFKKFANKMELAKTDLPCLKLNLIHYYLSIGNFIKMNKLINNLESQFRKEKNYLRLLDILNCKIIGSAYNDEEELTKCITEMINIIQQNSLPNVKISEGYNSIASAYHKMKNYKKALLYYEKARDKYEDTYLPNIIYMADCQNRLDLKISIPRIKNEDLENYPIGLRKMYNYFIKREDESPNFVKQNYIIKEILPYLQSEVNINIFRYELNRLAVLTGYYKNLSSFNIGVEQNINTDIYNT